MNRGKVFFRKMWPYLGIVPILFLVMVYLICESVFTDNAQVEVAKIFQAIIAVGLLASIVSIYYSQGKFKIMPIIGLLLGLISLAYLDFVINLTIIF